MEKGHQQEGNGQEKAMVVQYQSRDGQQIKLSFDAVRKYLVSGHPEWVTDTEIVLYMGQCKARGLNPFKKDCYLVKYTKDGPAATIVSIDYYRARAKAQEDCVGYTGGVILKMTDGSIEYREGSFVMDREELVGGWFKAQPRGWNVTRLWTVKLSRYIKKTKDGNITQFWQPDNQPEQIAKVAESQGLRRCWPDEFAKLYIKEEIVSGLPDQSSPIEMPTKTDKPDLKPEEKEPLAEPSLFEKLQAWLHVALEEQILATTNEITKGFPQLSDKEGQTILEMLNDRKREIIDARASGSTAK